MNYTYLRVFIENYSLPTLIISGVVSIINLLYDKFLAEKLPETVRKLVPFLLSILLYYAYDMIFVLKAFNFSAGTFSAGILSGSLSIIITASVYKLKNGKPISLNASAIIVENIISGLVSQHLLVPTVNEILNVLDNDHSDKEQAIISAIKNNSDIELDENELKILATLIVKAVLVVKQK